MEIFSAYIRITKPAAIGRLNQKTGLKILASFLIFLAIGHASAQTITPTQTDQIINDAGTVGKADQEETIRYTVTITETRGTTDATGVTLQVTCRGLTKSPGGGGTTPPLPVIS